MPARTGVDLYIYILVYFIIENVIGFAFPEYRVDEDQGEVIIAVQLMQIDQPDALGNLANPIMTRISTVDIGSASPSSNHILTIFITHFYDLISPLIR